MSTAERTDIKSMNMAELSAALQELGEPKFRAGQVFSWLHEKRVLRFEDMTNLPAAPVSYTHRCRQRQSAVCTEPR